MLEPGKPIERTLETNASHSYHIALDAGQFLRGMVDQRGVDVIITIYGPDDEKIADLNRPVGDRGVEPISVVTGSPGTYRLEIKGVQKDLPRGSYTIEIQTVRAATREDTTRVAADRKVAEATFAISERKAESLRRGIAKYSEALPLWQELEDAREEAFTLTAIGYTHANLAENQQALEYFDRALTLSRAAGNRDGEALALYSSGLVYTNVGDQQKALQFLNAALPIFQAAGNKSLEGATLGSIASAYVRLGEHERARAHYQQSLELKRQVGDRAGEATLLNNIGFVAFNTGDLQEALEFYEQALTLLRAIGVEQEVATTLNNIASVYDDLGEPERALELYKQVVEIKRRGGNRAEEATALNNIGRAYNNLGQHRQAVEFFNQSLPLSRASGVRSTEAVSLSNLGWAYSNLGENRKALEFYDQALAIQRQIGERRATAITLTNLARVHQDLGASQKAVDILLEALGIRRAVRHSTGEAVTLYNLARAHRDLNNLAEARTNFEAARVIVESQRTRLANQGLRTSYLASTQKYYELGIDVLMRLHREHPGQGFDAAALQTSESARARGLLELLTEARADIREGVPPAILEKERSLQKALDAAAAAQARLLAAKHSAEQATEAARRIERLSTEYEDVKAQIRQSSPRYAALTHPVPLTLEDIQARVVHEESILLEYALGDERSFLWAVSRDSIASFQLPARAEIDAAARRLYDVLNARNQFVPDETPDQRRRRLELADATFPEVSAALSRMLLGPVASHLGTRRLVVVPDGILHYIPFGALAVPEADASANIGDGYTPIIARHEVVTLPSASVLALIRKEEGNRQPAPRKLAVLADPVFYEDDARVDRQQGKTRSRAGKEAPAADVVRSAAQSGLRDFVRLRFSRQEARQITSLAPAGSTLMAVDFDASRATATSGDLERYAIVHFATHGLVNSRHPELSGIVLSLVDRNGRAQDGFLRLHEIYNLRLNADLVVLSACQTALGKEIRGEGLVGLTRGFMYAGVPRVVASLWQIDDQATADLMRRFYAGMLQQRLRPAAALRAAQVEMWRDKRWASPHYWAAFTLQGEWK